MKRIGLGRVVLEYIEDAGKVSNLIDKKLETHLRPGNSKQQMAAKKRAKAGSLTGAVGGWGKKPYARPSGYQACLDKNQKELGGALFRALSNSG